MDGKLRYAVALLLAVSSGCDSTDELLVGVRPDAKSFPTLLRSQLTRDGIESHFVPRFRLKNPTDQSVAVTLEKQDCNCFSVQIGDRHWEVGHEVEILPGTTVDVELDVEPSIEREWQTWSIHASGRRPSMGEDSPVQKIEMTAGMRVLEDVVVTPATIDLKYGQTETDGNAGSRHRLVIEHITEDPDELDAPPELISLPAWLVSSVPQRVGHAEALTKTFWRQKWHVALTAVAPPEHLPEYIRHQSQIVFSGGNETHRVAAPLPVITQRTAGLFFPRQIDLGEVPIGEWVKRKVVVRALDDQPFQFTTVESTVDSVDVADVSSSADVGSVQICEVALRFEKAGTTECAIKLGTDHESAEPAVISILAHVREAP